MTAPLRLLIDPPLSGPDNMARDEALLDAVAAGSSPTTLRCYQWSTPTVSLGYFQPYADFESVAAVRDFAVVRRTTGGGAILHDRELTYALVVPKPHELLADGPTSLYCRMHDAVIAVLGDLGIAARPRGDVSDRPETFGDRAEPFFCFARQHPLDVVVGSMKLAGSAQRRTPAGILQHGSIMLEAVHPEQPSADVRRHAAIGADELAHRIARRFADDNDLALETGVWRDDELARAEEHASRYNSPTWTRRR